MLNNDDRECGDLFIPPKASNRTYEFDFDELPEKVSIWLLEQEDDKEPTRQFAGEIGFHEIEYDDMEVLLIGDLAIEDGHRRLGLGRELIRRVAQCFNYVILAQHFTVSAQADGSHLIADGPHFVAKLVKERLVEWQNAPY